MPSLLADRVQETTTTTGTGTVSLAGASTGFRTFVAAVGTGNYCLYCIQAGSQWEVGLGAVTSGSPDTLSRETVLSSSNSNSLVSFSSGEKTVFLTYAADYNDCDFFVAGENLAVRDAVVLCTVDGSGTAGRIYKSDASYSGYSTNAVFVGFVLFTATTGQITIVRRRGLVYGFTGLTAGTQMFLSGATAGAITGTSPSNSRLVAMAIDTTTILVVTDQARQVTRTIPSGSSNFAGGTYSASSSNSAKADDIYVLDSTVNIGNASDKGELTVARSGLAGAYSIGIYSVVGGGYSSDVSGVIEYFERASLSVTATDAGELTVHRTSLAAAGGLHDSGDEGSSGMVFAGGQVSGGNSSQIDLIEEDTGFFGTVSDRGDLSLARRSLAGSHGVQSTTYRQFFGGGFTSAICNLIDRVDMTAVGTAVDKGDLTVARYGLCALGGNSAGQILFVGGFSTQNEAVIESIDVTTGIELASDIGELTVARSLSGGIGSEDIFGFVAGGIRGRETAIIDAVDIVTTIGNAYDRGELPSSRSELAGS